LVPPFRGPETQLFCQGKLDVDEFGSSGHDFLVASPLSMPHLPMYFNALVVQMWMPILLHRASKTPLKPHYVGQSFLAFWPRKTDFFPRGAATSDRGPNGFDVTPFAMLAMHTARVTKTTIA